MINICALVQKKGIILKLIKVKAHISIEDNERADKLAEEKMTRNIDSLDVNGGEVEENYIRATLV